MNVTDPGTDDTPGGAPAESRADPPADTRGASSRARRALAAAAILVPMIPIVVALTLGSGGPARAVTRSAAAPATHYIPVTPPVRAPVPNLLLPPGRGALVAVVDHGTGMRSRPGGHVFARLPARTPFGSPQALWVRRLSGSWLGVVSTIAGNNRIGWIPAADASLTRVDWELKVSLHARQLTVLESGRAVHRYTIAVGAPGSPTPTGTFAVTDRLATGDPSGPYGCCILALSATAPHAIADWNGGNRIAIHSTPETWTIGEPVSHGCMRLTLAEGRWLLSHIPIGTPTLISS